MGSRTKDRLTAQRDKRVKQKVRETLTDLLDDDDIDVPADVPVERVEGGRGAWVTVRVFVWLP